MRVWLVLGGTLVLHPILGGCSSDGSAEAGERAQGIYAPLGQPVPTATPAQLAAFDRGAAVAGRRFLPSEGLGPHANVSFCAACHEKPVVGGSGPRYRDFYIVGETLADGVFLPGGTNGVLASYGYHGAEARPGNDPSHNVAAPRNAIPFFGVGLIAELDEEAILAHEDPDDDDGDGISGRANYDQGFVGRFGRKSQTVSIEGFIRGPLFNHLGVTTDPLPPDLQAQLPVVSGTEVRAAGSRSGAAVPRQAAAPAAPLFDDDGVPDPELSDEDLFDLVSFTMLMAAPRPDDAPTPQAQRGALHFSDLGCDGCHVPSLRGPRGLVPLYSDLLLHDMGGDLADGVVQNLASGSEFRTQPLWGVAAAAPYLHDGRADTLHGAIVLHGGEALDSALGYAALSDAQQDEVVAFLESLGGVEQRSEGLLAPDAPVPASGKPGAPWGIAPSQRTRWVEGRRLFDRDAQLSDGLGPLFNGDSCRACHFDPVIGGAGPLDVNVMRFGTYGDEGFVADTRGTILHKLGTVGTPRPEHAQTHNVLEARQTPTVLGLGLIEQIAADDIVAGADPEDADGDGISGVAHDVDGYRLGRFGWKAQVPSVHEFVRDALSAELGLTVPDEPGLTYGVARDDDLVPDPEATVEQVETLAFYLSHLAYPPPKGDDARGREVFEDAGCARCHTPAFTTPRGDDVPLFSDLLLHDVAPEGSMGIPELDASLTEFRTPPLWGVSDTAPYMHDGSAETIAEAIEAHAGEADASRAAYASAPAEDRAALLRFVEQL